MWMHSKTILTPRKIIYCYYFCKNYIHTYYTDMHKHRLFINYDFPEGGVLGWLENKSGRKFYFSINFNYVPCVPTLKINIIYF